MEIRHLRYFMRAAELLHFTRAAESLYVSQPTLSTHIQQMEEELGAQLFARVGRNVRLTEAGELLLARARQAIFQLESAQREINAISGLLRGTLKLASLPLHGSRLLPGWISRFTSMHPDLHIRAHTANSEDIESAVLSGNIDMGFSFVPVEHSEIDTLPLFTDEIVMVMSKSHFLCGRKSIEIDDLDGLPAALISPRVSSSQFMVRYFEDLGVQPQTMVEFDDGNALLQIVRQGELVTLLPFRIVAQNSDLHIMRLPPPGIRVSLGALWVHETPASKAFLDLALAESGILDKEPRLAVL